MSFRSKIKAKRDTHTELELTPFLNLMVILIPALLLGAVFTQVSILGIEQPGDGPQGASAATPPELVLDVYLTSQGLDVKNRGHEDLGHFASNDYASLNALLHTIKTQHPKINSATLRVEPDMNYQDIVTTLDAIRTVESKESGRRYVLFPDIQLTGIEGAA